MAEGIGAVSVGERHVLGVVRLSQDLTGDLVFRDFVDGREQMVETGVSDMHITFDATTWATSSRSSCASGGRRPGATVCGPPSWNRCPNPIP